MTSVDASPSSSGPAGLVRPTGTLAAWIAIAVAVGVGTTVDLRLTLLVVAAALVVVLPFGWLSAAVFVAAALQTSTVAVGAYSVPIAAPLGIALLARALMARDRRRLGGPEIALIAFVGLLAISSVLHAGDVGASLRACLLVGSGVAAFIGLSGGLVTRAEAITALRALLVVLAANAAIGLAAVAAHVAGGTSWGVTLLEQPEGFPAATGLAFEHNLFGSTCAIGAIVFLGLWRVDNEVLERRASLLGFWLCAAGLVLSLTRGAWVGFLVGAVVLVMLTRRDAGRRNIGRIIAGGLALFIAVMTIAFVAGRGQDAGALVADAAGSVAEQGSRTLEFSKSTGYLRAAEWRTAIEDVSASPWFGLGANTFGERHVEKTLRGPVPSFLGNWAVRTAHDAGIVGSLLLAATFGALVWPGRRVRSAIGVDAALVRILCAAGLTMLVAYLAADAFLLVLPWAILGVFRAVRLSES